MCTIDEATRAASVDCQSATGGAPCSHVCVRGANKTGRRSRSGDSAASRRERPSGKSCVREKAEDQVDVATQTRHDTKTVRPTQAKAIDARALIVSGAFVASEDEDPFTLLEGAAADSAATDATRSFLFFFSNLQLYTPLVHTVPSRQPDAFPSRPPRSTVTFSTRMDGITRLCLTDRRRGEERTPEDV